MIAASHKYPYQIFDIVPFLHIGQSEARWQVLEKCRWGGLKRLWKTLFSKDAINQLKLVIAIHFYLLFFCFQRYKKKMYSWKGLTCIIKNYWYQKNLLYILFIPLAHFRSIMCFWTPRKHKKSFDFLFFAENIKMQTWTKIILSMFLF